jgi:carboxyl-terminal processing protease
MKHGRSILAPVMVLAIALVTGGWFLQRGVSTSGGSVYMQTRLFQEVVDRVQATYVEPVERDDLYDSAIEGMLEGLGDPNTSFIDAETWESFSLRSGAEAEYGGVGLEILRQNGIVTVINAMPGGPAKRMGIRSGDLIVGINGEDITEWDTDQAADKLRGAPGTEVELSIRRPGVAKPISFTFDRAVIELKSVPFAITLEDGIGYLPLQVFGETATTEIRDGLQALSDEGMRGLILDLRGNPGGLLNEGVAISDLFLDPGLPIVETKGRAPGQSEAFSATRDQIAPELPLVVLVNEGSASASEIVAGALQDHDRAVVVGARSFGKGSVQTLYRLSGGDILRLTTAKWFTPSGRSIQKDYAEQFGPGRFQNTAVALDGSRVDRPVLDSLPTFQSMGGRTIYGGGGILPDLIVVPDTLVGQELTAVQEIYAAAGGFRTELFDFAVRYIQDHADLRPGFELSTADVGAFHRQVAEAGIGVELQSLNRADRFIRYQLEREIALQAWGERGQFEQVRDRDEQLLAALALLKDQSDSQALVKVASEHVEREGRVTRAGRLAIGTGSH